MRICTKCQEEKSLTEFRIRNSKKGTFQSWCKACFSAYEKANWKTDRIDKVAKTRNATRRALKNKQFVLDYLLTKSCADCGESNPIVLQFDHIDRSKKRGNVSTMRSSYSLETLKEKINKCEVVCANCHLIRTVKTFNWYSWAEVSKTPTLSD